MNKRITPRVIKLIVIQSIILIVAVTTVGAAINVHSEYKNTGKAVNAQVEITTNTGANTTNNSGEMSKRMKARPPKKKQLSAKRKPKRS